MNRDSVSQWNRFAYISGHGLVWHFCNWNRIQAGFTNSKSGFRIANRIDFFTESAFTMNQTWVILSTVSSVGKWTLNNTLSAFLGTLFSPIFHQWLSHTPFIGRLIHKLQLQLNNMVPCRYWGFQYATCTIIIYNSVTVIGLTAIARNCNLVTLDII